METSKNIRKARLAAQAKDYALAQTIMSEVLQTDPDNPQAWLVMANVVESKKQARFCLERVLTLDPGNEAALLRLDRLNQWEASTLIMAKPDVTGTSDPDDPEATVLEPPTEGPDPNQIDWDQPLSKQIDVEPSGSEETGDDELQEPAPKRKRRPRRRSRLSPLELVFLVSVVGVLCCVITLAVGQFTGLTLSELGLNLGAVPEAVETPSGAVTDVVTEHFLAHNDEDLDRVMATYHPASPAYQANRILLTGLFSQYDLATTTSDVQLVSQDVEEAVVSLTITNRKLAGPNYQDNRIETLMTFRPDNGQWKLYSQEAVQTELLP